MKVLMSAYACEPGKGSEPGTGWAWTRAAALDNEVWVLTRENNQPAIEQALAAEPHLNLHPVYLDLPTWARWWKRGGRGVRSYYVLWQILARRTAKRLHQQHQFDVAHHITFGVDWLPAGVIGIRGLPSVWGPVGGAAPFPWRLWRWLGFGGIVSELVRWVSGGLGRRVFGDRLARQADLVAVQNKEVAHRFRSAQPVIEPHVAIDPEQCRRTSDRASAEPRTALYVGRLVRWKGIRLAVATLAEPAAADWRLRVLGDGPDRAGAQRYAQKLGVADRICFEGAVERTKVVEALHRSTCFLFPSMHDSASWAVAEAISAGTPVVCLDVGGPPVQLARCGGGAAVQADDRAAEGLAQALHEADPSRTSNAIQVGRLPGVLSDWYSGAIARNGTRPGMTRPL